MKKIILSLGFAALALGATAQVKIKDGSVTGSSTTPNSNAILELESNNKGLLYPRVSLTATNAALPGTTMVAGMVVYNTNTTTGANGVTPGFYYSDGTQWIQLVSSNSLPASTVFLYGAGTPAAAGATCNSAAQNTIYVDTGSTSATQGQTWICDGTNWQNYNAPASTAWYLAGSNTADAGANKTANIARTGSVVIGATTTPARVAADTSSSTAAQQLAALTVTGGDASINTLAVGMGGGQLTSNTALGRFTLYSNTTGTQNVAVGAGSLIYNTTGNFNTGVGYNTLHYGGSSNTAVGNTALFNATGTNNTALGVNAGSALTTGTGNIAIGSNQDLASNTANYQLNIGGAIFGTGLFGSVGTPRGNIGIGTVAPNSSFQVAGSVSMPARTISTTPTLGATDYTVVVTSGSVSLPAASATAGTGNLGRIYRIINKSGAAITINNVTALASAGTSISVANNTAVTVQCVDTSGGSGTSAAWYQVQ